MRQRTVSFHVLMAIVGVLLSILCAVFVVHHEITVGSKYYGWECVPMIYFVLSLFLIPASLLIWALNSGLVERVWEWNPTFTFGKKLTIPKATIEKDNS